MVKAERVLLIAYACEPDKTSEPGVGWNFGNQIAKCYDTLILTRANNRPSIELKKPSNITFLYYDLPAVFIKLKKRMPLGTQLYYVLWQWGAYFYAAKYIKNNSIPISLVHHLNFAVSWIAPPNYLLKTPFVWGPIGGGDNVPIRFLKDMGTKALLQEILYIMVNQISRVSIFSLLTRRAANAILFRTKSLEQNFPKRKNILYKTISETAMHSKDFEFPIKHRNGKSIKAICVGRMGYWKGFIYAVKGFHRYLQSGGKGTLELFGEGPEKEKIKKYIEKNRLNDKIFVRGFVNNPEIKRKLSESDILIHPSFREGGSWSIMEAMSHGLPVICLDTSGPKDMVTEECGLLIGLTSPQKLIGKIGEALLKLSGDKEKYLEFSSNAQRRIKEEYNWTERKKQMERIYETILNELQE